MKSSNKIIIKREVLGFRDNAKQIKRHILKLIKNNPKKYVVIDFSNVRFAAANFMDEWMNVLEYCKKNKIKVIQMKRNYDVKMMQKVIENRRKNILKSAGRFKI
jgi:anti-anti-sigma regulatory factor